MKWAVGMCLLLAAYLASGIYIVGANEAAVVRRCGKVVRNEDGAVALRSSGLHIDLPTPFAQIDRFNVNQERTLTIGLGEAEGVDSTNFLQSVDLSRQSQFITGDKNIMNVQITVHYSVSAELIEDYLFGSASTERRLRLLSESVIGDTVVQSGVDFVHTLGRNEVRKQIIVDLNQLVQRQSLGIEIGDVTIGSVYPPVRVKADFLDVTNARADKETYINKARAYGEQREADALAIRQKINDGARTYSSQTLQAAKSQADNFNRLVAQFKRAEANEQQTYESARELALRRKYSEITGSILRKAKSKVVLDSGKPVDITIVRDPES